MKVINAQNVNDALVGGLELLYAHGVQEDSRNGPVLRAPTPVTTVLQRPLERVLFAPWRDANPFFHLVEALWMIAGRDDVAALTLYVNRMAAYSDDGHIVPGAYGRRWRSWFDENVETDKVGPTLDQLNWAVERLRANPQDRRVVIQMWDAQVDPHRADWGSKDVPCNLTALPWIQNGTLHLTIFNRSNDIIWGLYGANAVHFSFLLEYLAARLGLSVGTMTTVSNNFHAYVDKMPPTGVDFGVVVDHYHEGLSPRVEPYPIFQGFDEYPGLGRADEHREQLIREDLLILFEHGWREAATKARWPLIRQVAVPMMAAHEHWRTHKKHDGCYREVMGILEQCQAQDWRLAAHQWMARRGKEKTNA